VKSTQCAVAKITENIYNIKICGLTGNGRKHFHAETDSTLLA